MLQTLLREDSGLLSAKSNGVRFAPLLALVALLGLPAHAEAEIYAFTDEEGVTHFSDAPRHAGYRRFRPTARLALAPRPRITAKPSPRGWDGAIAQAGRNHGVSPGLVKAVVHAESAFDPDAVSHKGAQGLMQLMPATARQLGVDDPFDPWQNIDGGTRYLSSLIQRFNGDLSLGLAAYHAGERAVRRYSGIPPYRETRRYVKKVLSLHERYDADFR